MRNIKNKALVYSGLTGVQLLQWTFLQQNIALYFQQKISRSYPYRNFKNWHLRYKRYNSAIHFPIRRHLDFAHIRTSTLR